MVRCSGGAYLLRVDDLLTLRQYADPSLDHLYSGGMSASELRKRDGRWEPHTRGEGGVRLVGGGDLWCYHSVRCVMAVRRGAVTDGGGVGVGGGKGQRTVHRVLIRSGLMLLMHASSVFPGKSGHLGSAVPYFDCNCRAGHDCNRRATHAVSAIGDFHRARPHRVV